MTFLARDTISESTTIMNAEVIIRESREHSRSELLGMNDSIVRIPRRWKGTLRMREKKRSVKKERI